MGELMFCCPKCGGKLRESEKSASCAAGHSYDKSKYGYYNLLLSNSGGTHGDNKEMVLARRAHLSSGKYAPLAERVCALAVKYSKENCTLLDIGSGEGYYTEQLLSALSRCGASPRVGAFDISKDAVRELMKKCKGIDSAVASAYQMPVADSSFDIAVNAFSPFSREEILRALKPQGVLIMAIPEVEHLFELKEVLYRSPYKNEVKDSHLEGFSLIESERVTFTMRLASAEEIENLFKMTPYAYRTPREADEKLRSLDGLDVTADFRLFVYRKD